jgi:hypothetical protein
VVFGQGGHDLWVTDDERWVDTLGLDEFTDELELVTFLKEGRGERRTLSSRRALVLGSLQSTLC